MSLSSTAPVVVPATAPRRAVIASLFGSTIERYDFFIYGTAASLALGPQFFPNSSDTAALLASFATFAIGFIARPIGGAVMGHFGDRLGRKAMLVVTLGLMGAATVAIGLLPNYATIGVWAPILLVAFRFLQGFGVGGEWGGAVLIATEHAPRGKAGLYGVAPQLGVPAGVLLANLAFLLVSNTTSPAQFQTWGWRIPFLVSAVLIGVAAWVRLGVAESPEFMRTAAEDETLRLPLVEVFRGYWRTVLLAAGTFVGTNGIGIVWLTFAISYGSTTLGVAKTTLLLLVVAAGPIWMLGQVMTALLSDLMPRRTVYRAAAVFLVFVAAVFFPIFDTGSVPMIALAMQLMGLGLGVTAGPQSAFFAELFPGQHPLLRRQLRLPDRRDRWRRDRTVHCHGTVQCVRLDHSCHRLLPGAHAAQRP